MANGRPGDHPFTDILHHGSSEFGEPVDTLVKRMSEHPLFFKVSDDVADLLWEKSPFGRQTEKATLLAETEKGLTAISVRLAKLAEEE
ncbi:hypothetical protein [Sphingopyxis sp. NJF-3]